MAKRTLGSICETATANLEGEDVLMRHSRIEADSGHVTEGVVLKAAESVYNDPWLRWVKVKVSQLRASAEKLALKRSAVYYNKSATTSLASAIAWIWPLLAPVGTKIVLGSYEVSKALIRPLKRIFTLFAIGSGRRRIHDLFRCRTHKQGTDDDESRGVSSSLLHWKGSLTLVYRRDHTLKFFSRSPMV